MDWPTIIIILLALAALFGVEVLGTIAVNLAITLLVNLGAGALFRR